VVELKVTLEVDSNIAERLNDLVLLKGSPAKVADMLECTETYVRAIVRMVNSPGKRLERDINKLWKKEFWK
jgi:hypothetical protein